MAKTSAYDYYEVASVNAAISIPDPDDGNKTKWVSYRFVLRSDGTILSRPRGSRTSNFSIWRKFKRERLKKKELVLNEDLLRKVIKAFSFVPIDEMELLDTR